MKYISIDIETSGLEHDKHQVLSFAAIIEDTTLKLPFSEIPKFKCVIKRHDVEGSIRALMINENLLKLLDEYMSSETHEEKKLIEERTGYVFLDEEHLAQEFYRFLARNGMLNRRGEDMSDIQFINFNGSTQPIVINVAGKNFSTFDKLFLDKLPWWKKLIHVRQRILDPSILFVDWYNDESLPSLIRCKNRADIDGIVTHDAMDDAWDVVELLRKHY